MDNRRLLLAAFLSLLVLIVWNTIFPPPVVPPAPVEPGSAAEDAEPYGLAEEQPRRERSDPDRTSGETAGLAAEAPDEDLVGGAPVDEVPLIDFGAEQVVAEAEERVVLENDAVRAEFSTRGAQLVSFQLKQDLTTDGEPLELIKARGNDPYPFALVEGGERGHRLNNALFVVSRDSGPDGDPELRFRHRSSRGAAEKVFRLTPEDLLGVEISVVGESRWSIFLGPGLRSPGNQTGDDRFLQRGVGYLRGDEIKFLRPKRKNEDVLLPAFGLRWITLENNFFLTALIPADGVGEVMIRSVIERGRFEEDRPRFFPATVDLDEEELRDEQLVLIESAGERMRLLALFDAKRYKRLADLGLGLEKTVRWGWFGFLAKPIYFGLVWIYENVVTNYGWAIVIITCLIRLIFFPLTHKSQESMTKMQELNPKVQAVRAKFRSKLKDKQGRPNVDAQRQMNEEIMKIYKTAGVNPAGGCLPVLLQMPVFFAFFRVLSTAVELRNAEWIGWIHDLSDRDPYFVLPIVMGATSIGMQKMMPSSPDPMQRRMIQMMPIVFTVFALYFPSGLVLYWLTNNLLSMAQQALLMKMRKRKEEEKES